MKSAVLFVVFNRPDTTAQVFEEIRRAKPPKLYVAADGPRAGRPTESDRCAAVRTIATAVDWECEVSTLFQPVNLGCKFGVSRAINWFFENESEGIILEDDVLPQQSFFQYCDELLVRYRDVESIGAISGSNLISDRFEPIESYFFSRYNHVWGWASWRRAWQDYDVNMINWPAWRDAGGLRRLFAHNVAAQAYWRSILDSVYRGEIDTWDYQWMFSCWSKGRISAIPQFNQTDNVGFGNDATHTTSGAPQSLLSSRPKALGFPLRHPGPLQRDELADKIIDRFAFGITWWRVWLRQVRILVRRFMGALSGPRST